MPELNIRQPCVDCPLMATEQDVRLLWEQRLSRVDTVLLEGCRHPWRVAYLALGPNPNTPQRMIMAQLVELKGKDPDDYGLPQAQELSRSESDQRAIEEQKVEAKRVMLDMLIDVMLEDLPQETIVEKLEALMTEFCCREDFDPSWAAEALLEAQEYVATLADTN